MPIDRNGFVGYLREFGKEGGQRVQESHDAEVVTVSDGESSMSFVTLRTR